MHLFAGVGGGLLADLILGHTPVVAVEWDGYACQVLRERAADGWFPDLRVWEGDVRLFDPSEYAGKVDCIHAGFPCQDISVAGKQAGVSDGTRSGLYREVLRIAGVVRPKQLFLENVSAIISNGLGTVLGDLAALGYDTRWLCIRASDVGAPHHRDRWFLLSNANDDRCGDREIQYVNRWDAAPNSGNDGKTQYVADTERQRLQGQGQHEQSSNPTQGGDWKATESEYGGSSNSWSTEPELGGMVDEFSAWFYKNILNNPISHCKITAQLMECCNETKARRIEVLRILRNGDVTKEIQQSSGRLLSVYETALLLAKLCEYKNESDKARVFMESAETLKTELRGMWLRKEVAGTSHRSRQDKQRSDQHSDTVQTLPRLLAHAGEEDAECCRRKDAASTWWQVEPNIGRVANGVPHRVHRLKGLGNAQVPLQAAVAYRLLGG